MTKRRSSNKKKELDPHIILSGRASFTAYDLIRMIHRVNPTNKGMKGKEKSENYKIKNRLQSLLIHKFSDSLIIEQSSNENPLLVGIKLKHYADDACHVYMNELDDDARSWCQSQIDEALVDGTARDVTCPKRKSEIKKAQCAGPRQESSQNIDRLSEKELIRLSKRAFDEYDYVASETYGRKALEISFDSIEPALLLLELFTDYLANYEKAIHLAESLPTTIKKDKKIRAFIALAAARSGNINLALEQIGTSTLPQSAEVHMIALKYFIQQRDVDRGKKQLSALRAFKNDELKLPIDKFEHEIEALEAEKCKPHENAILQLWEKQQFDDAAKLAKTLLSTHPQSKTARKIIDKFDKQVRLKKIKKFLSEADDANQKNDFLAETELLKKAIANGANKACLQDRFNYSKKKAALQKEEQEISRIIALFQSGQQHDALLNFCTFKAQTRSRVISRIEDPHFLWVDQCILSQNRLKRERIVKAALTFGKFKEMYDEKVDLQVIRAELDHYLAELQSIPEAVDFLERIEKTLLESENDKVENTLLEVDDFVENGSLTSARELLNNLKVSRLNTDHKRYYYDLDSRLSKLERIESLDIQYTEYFAKKDYFRCIKIAGELANVVDDEGSEKWAAKKRELSAQIKKKMCFTILDISQLPFYYGCNELNWISENPNCCLRSREQQLIIVNCKKHWIFLAFYCLRKETLTKGIIFYAPAPMSMPTITSLENEIWIAGEDGCVVELSIDPPDILNWHDCQKTIAHSESSAQVEQTMLFPRSRCLFVNSLPTGRMEDETCEFINIDDARILRKIKTSGYPYIFKNGENYLIAMANSTSDKLHIYTENGRLARDVEIRDGRDVSSVAMHPNGSDLIFLTHHRDDSFAPFRNIVPDAPQQDTDHLCLSLNLQSDENTHKPLKLENSNYELYHSMVTSRSSGFVFVGYSGDRIGDEHFRISGFKVTESGFVQLYQIKTPYRFGFVSDGAGDHVACILLLNNKINVVILDENKPLFPPENELPKSDIHLPDFLRLIFCTEPTNSIKAHGLAIMGMIKDSTYEQYQQLLHNHKYDNDKTADDLTALVYALQRLYSSADAENIRKTLHEKYPNHLRVSFDNACKAAEERNWDQVISLLHDLPRQEIDDGTACHICHILGIGHFARGDIERARSLWVEGIGYEEGECSLESLIDYANISLLPAEIRRKRKDPVSSVLTFFETVDNCLIGKEWLKAIKLIETNEIVAKSDMQVLARLAEAYLQLDVEYASMRWLCKIYALSNFCNNLGEVRFRIEQMLPPFIETWSENRFLYLKTRAENWLEETAGDSEMFEHGLPRKRG